MNLYENLTGKYSVSKTLCFDLIPQGKTLENIISNGILDEDEHRAESVGKVKKLIDDFHKSFIDSVLDNVKLQKLNDYYDYFVMTNRDEKDRQRFLHITDNLRKEIADSFKSHPLFKKMFGKELFTEILPKHCNSEEEFSLLEEFKGFTTYFTGFNNTRKNIYSDEAIVSSVAYRLIHNNLPLFIQNIFLFDKLEQKIEGIRDLLNRDFGSHISGSIDDYFTLDGYNKVLSQKAISAYNLLIGGYSTETGDKIKGINEYINLHNQKSERADRLSFFKPLKKQILSDVQSFSFILDKFETDEDVERAINKYWMSVRPVLGGNNTSEHGSISSMLQLLLNIRTYELEEIYVRSDFIKTLSQRLFGKWNLLSLAMDAWYDQNYSGKKKAGTKAYEQEKESFFKNKDRYSISFINECCAYLDETKEAHVERFFERYCDEDYRNFSVILPELEKEMRYYFDSADSQEKSKKSIKNRKGAVNAVKKFLDEIMEYYHFLSPLSVKADSLKAGNEFYDSFVPFYDVVSGIVPLYNKVRNYMTKKPYSNEKIKLNFSNALLLSGWSVSKESSNSAVMLRKDGLYYLGIMDKSAKKIFEGSYPSDGEVYEKMEYRLLPGPNKMLPKIFLASKNAVDIFQPSEQVLSIYKNGTFKKGDNFSLDDCHILIDYFKSCIQKYEEWNKFDFKFSDTKTYEDISGFYREVEHQGYKMTFRDVSQAYVDQMVEEGKLYLFQIYNKDFSPYSKGTPNLHTLYFKALFTPENLSNVVYKLNGDAEIFYRKKSIDSDNVITHPANEPVINKNPLNTNKESLFKYTLYKDRRYTVDKFQFHVPITMNFKATGTERINLDVNMALKSSDDTYVIGINRGERHLLYVTVIDSSGRIIEDYSLNEIVNEYKGVVHRTDYHSLLENKANDRDASRKNWDTIENIKDLKEGYISQVVHKITQLMSKYQAVVVIEDLNFGFLRGRQHIEKNVYQKFVEKLINKLNYYVDKNIDADKNGGLYHAYQLANGFESIKKLGKQSGVLFFAPSYYISNIDPTTGFVNLLYVKYENVKAAKDFFTKFDDIYFDAEHDYFCFDIDYSRFTDKAAGTKENWTLCSYGERVRTFRNPAKNMMWDAEVVYPTELLKELFYRYNVEFEGQPEVSLKDSILAQSDKGFFKELMHALEITLQMRNYGEEIDYIISPVLNKNGNFFDSRSGIMGLPSNIESNGAYNIARKGLWMINQIKNAEYDKLGKEKLAMSVQDWLCFAQK